jgi:hypothetical protein
MLAARGIEVVALVDALAPTTTGDHAAARGDPRFLELSQLLPSVETFEDMFTTSEYLGAVREAYSAIGDGVLDLPGEAGIVARLEDLFRREALGPFERWKPAAILRDQVFADGVKLSEEARAAAEVLLRAVNALFGPTGPGARES